MSEQVLRLGNFLNDLEQGHEDAGPVLEKFDALGYSVEQAPLSDDRYKGIDFYLTDSNGLRSSVQLKCCRRIADTKNVYFQRSKVVPVPEKMKSVDATNWLYYDVNNRIIYHFKTEELVKRWNEIAENGRFHKMKQKSGGETDGFIVSLERLRELGFKFKEVQI